jgi:ribosome-associated protein
MKQDDLTEVELEQELSSRTQLKNEAKELHAFGKLLVELSAEKLSLLPLNETTHAALEDFHKQSGNIAKKRHLAYIAKCLRADDVSEAKQILTNDEFSQRRAQLAKSDETESQPKLDKNAQLIVVLMADGDQQIQQLVEKNPSLDRQTLRQLVRNANNAKVEKKINQAKQKLAAFIKQNKLA